MELHAYVHHREPSRPKTIVFGQPCRTARRGSDTPLSDRPKPMTETNPDPKPDLYRLRAGR